MRREDRETGRRSWGSGSSDMAIAHRYYSRPRRPGQGEAPGRRPGGTDLDPRARLKALIAEKCILRGEFTLASGQKSNVYFDCKRATLDPEGLHLLGILLLEVIDRLEKDDGHRIDAIGGPTIGADPVVGHVAGASWARHLGGGVAARTRPAAGGSAGAPASGHPVKAFLVRKVTKDHGTGRLIENDIPKGSRVLVFEDVVTTAKSTLEAIATMEQAGLDIAAIAAVVDREQGGGEALAPRRFLPLFRKSEFGL